MYHNLGINWASTLVAFLALICTPMPFLFYRYGASVRQRCRYAKQAHEVQMQIKEGSRMQRKLEVEAHGEAEVEREEAAARKREGLPPLQPADSAETRTHEAPPVEKTIEGNGPDNAGPKAAR
jgi:hypothetical protein